MAVSDIKRATQDKGDRVLVYRPYKGRLGGKFMQDSPSVYTHFTEWAAGAYTATGPITPDGPLTYTSTGTAVTNPTIGGLGGELTLTTDDVQNSAEELSTNLFMEVDTNAPLVFEARLKVSGAASSTFATREAFFGFSDRTTATSGRPYTVTTGSAITGTNVPADFAGFAISGVPTSGVLFNASNKTNVGIITSVATVDTIVPATFDDGGVFAAEASATRGTLNDTATYHVYRIEVGAGGVANFFVDGRYCGTSATALTATVPLSAYFDVVTLTASAASTSATMTIDYIYAGASSTWAA